MAVRIHGITSGANHLVTSQRIAVQMMMGVSSIVLLHFDVRFFVMIVTEQFLKDNNAGNG